MEELLSALEREALETAEETLAGARVRAARIRERAAAEEARLKAEHLGGVEEEERGRAARALVEARRRARRAVLAARAGLLERVFERAILDLPGALASSHTRRSLALDAGRALRFLPDVEAVLECPPVLAEEMGQAVAGHGKVRVESLEGALPGAVLRTAGRELVVDDTLPARLERMRPELAIAIVEALREEAS